MKPFLHLSLCHSRFDLFCCKSIICLIPLHLLNSQGMQNCCPKMSFQTFNFFFFKFKYFTTSARTLLQRFYASKYEIKASLEARIILVKLTIAINMFSFIIIILTTLPYSPCQAHHAHPVLPRV